MILDISFLPVTDLRVCSNLLLQFPFSIHVNWIDLSKADFKVLNCGTELFKHLSIVCLLPKSLAVHLADADLGSL